MATPPRFTGMLALLSAAGSQYSLPSAQLQELRMLYPSLPPVPLAARKELRAGEFRLRKEKTAFLARVLCERECLCLHHTSLNKK
jgi:hypothetical protein